MVRISWKDRYNIGYKDIDTQHQRLLAILNELADLQVESVDANRVSELFHELCQYALTHFSQEERYMEAAGYPDLVSHRAEHGQFIQDLLALNASFEPGDPHLPAATFEFVKTWYLRHIIQVDQAYVPYLKGFRARAEIKGLLFSLSGVICGVDEQRFLTAAAPLWKRSVAEAAHLVESESALFRSYALGDIGTEAFLQALAPWEEASPERRAFCEAYTQVFSLHHPTLEAIGTLRQRYKVGLLADTTPLRWEHLCDQEGILQRFDAVTTTWELGAQKPDAVLLEDLASRLDLMVEECVYVDAHPAFALAATNHLARGVVVPTPESLAPQLRRLKVIVEETATSP